MIICNMYSQLKDEYNLNKIISFFIEIESKNNFDRDIKWLIYYYDFHCISRINYTRTMVSIHKITLEIKLMIKKSTP